MKNRFIPINEPIDLLNVAFENPRSLKAQRGRHNRHVPPSADQNIRDLTHPVNTYDVPDRQTGLEELEELKALCPGRVWNFVSLYLCMIGFTSWLGCPLQVKVDVTFEVSIFRSIRSSIFNLRYPCYRAGINRFEAHD